MLSLDHPSVQDVLQIAEEIASENKFLDTRTIYQRAKRKLKIPRKGLLQIIQLLIDQKVLVDGSKFTRKSVLNNNFRNQVFQIISNNLGIHFSDLKRKFFAKKMGSTGQLVWHLDMLIKFNYVKKIDYKNYTIFVPIDVDDDCALIHFLLHDNTNKQIFFMYVDADCLPRHLIYSNLEEKRESIYYRLNELEKAGFIIFKDNGLVCISISTKDILRTILKEKYKVMEVPKG